MSVRRNIAPEVARRRTDGQRRAIILHAYLLHHGGRITVTELTRTVRTFRR